MGCQVPSWLTEGAAVRIRGDRGDAELPGAIVKVKGAPLKQSCALNSVAGIKLYK
jgi:hypothetical protein